MNESDKGLTTETSSVPVIDLSRDDDDPELIRQVADACQEPGFFQVIHHGVNTNLIASFQQQMHAFFALPDHVKDGLRRHAHNARGYFDNELTQQKRDHKQCLDVGVPGSRQWSVPDHDTRNICLDGYNQFPSRQQLPNYRRVTCEYFAACTILSHRLATLMVKGLLLQQADERGVDAETWMDDQVARDFLKTLYETHTSYLRTNYYPVYANSQHGGISNQNDDDVAPNHVLGISPHRDAGFLTVLWQDPGCHSLQVFHDRDQTWRLVHPLPDSMTVNIGDMAQIWSNGRFRAPLHRVLTHQENKRYSAPFFYNPGYDQWIAPMVQQSTLERERYHACLWGYFRAMRFAGDFTDLGLEIQVSDFENSDEKKSPHVKRQERFAQHGMANRPFDVHEYAKLFLEK